MFVKEFHRNISMWDFVLKNLLQRTWWCNRILIMILGLGAMTFLPKKVWDISWRRLFWNLLHACWLGCVERGPKLQCGSNTIETTQFRKKIIVKRGGGGRRVDSCHLARHVGVPAYTRQLGKDQPILFCDEIAWIETWAKQGAVACWDPGPRAPGYPDASQATQSLVQSGP
jgi:hypothetical protein